MIVPFSYNTNKQKSKQIIVREKIISINILIFIIEEKKKVI